MLLQGYLEPIKGLFVFCSVKGRIWPGCKVVVLFGHVPCLPLFGLRKPVVCL